jgi:hypothetical protein
LGDPAEQLPGPDIAAVFAKSPLEPLPTFAEVRALAVPDAFAARFPGPAAAAADIAELVAVLDQPGPIQFMPGPVWGRYIE